jgi:CheY-like chemotaxis protein
MRPPSRRPRVVAVNHSPEFLALIADLLEGEGYDAVVPPDLERPFAFVKAQRPDAVVLDVLFRRESESLMVLDLLALDPDTTRIPVVLCTTSLTALEGVQARAAARGIRVLVKPFDLEELLAALRAALGPAAP